MKGARAVLLVVAVAGCGGRAEQGGAVAGSPAGQTPDGTGGEIGGAHGGLGDNGGAISTEAGGSAGTVVPTDDPTINVIDEERPGAGRPTTPDAAPSAFFWGSAAGGWLIGNWGLVFDGGYRDVALSMIAPPRAGSTEARHVSGAASMSGAVLGAQLDHLRQTAVDLSRYSGLSFWVRLTSQSSRLKVVLNDGSRPLNVLSEAPGAPSVALVAGPTWQKVTLPFGTFMVTRPAVASIDFRVGEDGEAWDLWIDDLAFLCVGACS